MKRLQNSRGPPPAKQERKQQLSFRLIDQQEQATCTEHASAPQASVTYKPGRRTGFDDDGRSILCSMPAQDLRGGIAQTTVHTSRKSLSGKGTSTRTWHLRDKDSSLPRYTICDALKRDDSIFFFRAKVMASPWPDVPHNAMSHCRMQRKGVRGSGRALWNLDFSQLHPHPDPVQH